MFSSFLPPPDYSWFALFVSPLRNSKGFGARAAVFASLLPQHPTASPQQLPRDYSRWGDDKVTIPLLCHFVTLSPPTPYTLHNILLNIL